jgi:hypothetical protein
VAWAEFLNTATAREPVCVLGAAAAQPLGIDQVFGGERIRITGVSGNGDMWRPLRPPEGLARRHPTEAWAGGLAATLLIGALAGLLPAIRAARLSPTQALWSM